MSIASLNYCRTGEGPVLLVIHGLFGSSRNWQGLARQFATHLDVITVDLRNHGDSPHLAGMDYASMAQDIIALLEALEIDRCSILGHSMGGKVAMKVTQLLPTNVERLVVADIAPQAYTHNYDQLLNAVMGLNLDNIGTRRQADQRLAMHIDDARNRQFLLQNLIIGEETSQWKINWPVLKQHMSTITGYETIEDWQIDVPSLFIYGGLSDYVTESGRLLIRQHFKRARFSCIKNAGHWLHAEQPQIFYQIVDHFLRTK